MASDVTTSPAAPGRFRTRAVSPAVAQAAAIAHWTSTGSARALRIEAGLTLRDVGEELEIDPAAVSRWERGERRPRGRNLRLYHEFLAGLAVGS